LSEGGCRTADKTAEDKNTWNVRIKWILEEIRF